MVRKPTVALKLFKLDRRSNAVFNPSLLLFWQIRLSAGAAAWKGKGGGEMWTGGVPQPIKCALCAGGLLQS
jgi:hypothetical protein